MADESTTAAVDAKTWYDQNVDKEREYVRVYSAIPAKPGDRWTEAGVISVARGVKEEGYIIKAYSGFHDMREAFLDKDEFAEKAAPAGALYPSQPPSDLDKDDLAALTPIKKGKDFLSMGIFSASAECDGFLLKGQDGNNSFVSNYALTSAFNYAGKKFDSDGATVVSMKDESPVRGIIVDEDVTFNFKTGPYEVKKGGFVMINPDDEDGYTAFPAGYAVFGLRRNQSDEQMAAISNVKVDEKVAVGHALRLKPKG
jgi:hypothetical protein